MRQQDAHPQTPSATEYWNTVIKQATAVSFPVPSYSLLMTMFSRHDDAQPHEQSGPSASITSLSGFSSYQYVLS
jgi:hypothetical protein